MSAQHDGEFKRWYDRDPALSKALEQLRNASDAYQAQIALNIIKVIVEHQTEEDSDVTVEELTYKADNGETITAERNRRRWYDVNETLRSAMQLLHDCPPDLQQSVIPTITRMIEETLSQY